MLKKIFAMLRSKHAFTLLESLFSLLIFIIIASFVPLIFQSYQSVLKVMDIDKNYEWQLFLNQARKELMTSSELTVSDHKIDFYSQSKLITYASYQNMTRRSVDNKGHEPLLTNIKQDKWFKKADNQLVYKVLFEDGNELTARFYIHTERNK
ncbi:competence protein ComGF [Listeria grandensis]|nr:competence type IV pilus minor pilin ComGF [Listeria grandensis]MBC1473099.1 competence protein ComGF [Listeria grandensis]